MNPFRWLQRGTPGALPCDLHDPKVVGANPATDGSRGLLRILIGIVRSRGCQDPIRSPLPALPAGQAAKYDRAASGFRLQQSAATKPVLIHVLSQCADSHRISFKRHAIGFHRALRSGGTPNLRMIACSGIATPVARAPTDSRNLVRYRTVSAVTRRPITPCRGPRPSFLEENV